MEKKERSVSVAQRTPSGDYSSTTNMVPTVGGAVHYVKKQIGFGGQGVVKEEAIVTAKDDEAGANVDFQKSGTRFSLKRSKSTRSVARSRSEGNLALQGITGDGQQGLCHALPPRGELRYVYLDMSWTRFGFTLQVNPIAMQCCIHYKLVWENYSVHVVVKYLNRHAMQIAL